MLPRILQSSTCPACGDHVAVPFYDGGQQPLATIAWPATAEEALAMHRLPLDFVRCVECGHIFNAQFDFAQVPYSKKPNLMFNSGKIWQEYLKQVRDLILNALPAQPTVVEVGCGEGHLLRALAEQRPTGRYVGFDLNSAIDTGGGKVEARQSLFEPEPHLAELRPDLIISRHVLEHLMNPLGFVQAIAFAASWEKLDVRLFIEVPCIDRAVALGRTVDFFYEHNSNFTMLSLTRLLERCAADVELVQRGYDDEVIFGLARFSPRPQQLEMAREALEFHQRARENRTKLVAAFNKLHAGGKSVAIWGGTGKASTFIQQNGLNRERFPLVVDSDRDKVGTFVPGVGQEIRFRDYLVDNPVDVIVIATQWRAKDIVLEIQKARIPYQQILLEHEGRLVDYFADDHPYR